MFAALPSVALAPLRRVMDAAVRFVASLGPRDHTSEAQRELHCLPIEECITCNTVSSCTPSKQVAHQNTSRTWSPRCLIVKGVRTCVQLLWDCMMYHARIRTLMGSKAFSVSGLTAWNSLPQSIRDIKLASAFKRHRKAHLFKCAYQ